MIKYEEIRILKGVLLKKQEEKDINVAEAQKDTSDKELCIGKITVTSPEAIQKGIEINDTIAYYQDAGTKYKIYNNEKTYNKEYLKLPLDKIVFLFKDENNKLKTKTTKK